jgi:hypothetical protein
MYEQIIESVDYIHQRLNSHRPITTLMLLMVQDSGYVTNELAQYVGI